MCLFLDLWLREFQWYCKSVHSSNVFQTLPVPELSGPGWHYFQGIFQVIFSKEYSIIFNEYFNEYFPNPASTWTQWKDQRDITFKLCFIIAAAANLLKPSRMFPPINYQLSVMKYLYLLWPLVHICMTDLRKLHILHFCPSGNTIKRTVAVKVGCLNFGKKSDVTVEPVRTVKTFTELL